MTREQVWRWVAEARALFAQREQFERMMAESKAALELSSETGNTTQMEQIQRSREQLTSVYDACTALIERKCGVAAARAEDLVQSIEARLQAHAELVREVKLMEAHFEMAVATGEFAADERVEAEKSLTESRARVALQLEKAADLIPDKPQLVLA